MSNTVREDRMKLRVGGYQVLDPFNFNQEFMERVSTAKMSAESNVTFANTK